MIRCLSNLTSPYPQAPLRVLMDPSPKHGLRKACGGNEGVSAASFGRKHWQKYIKLLTVLLMVSCHHHVYSFP